MPKPPQPRSPRMISPVLGAVAAFLVGAVSVLVLRTNPTHPNPTSASNDHSRPEPLEIELPAADGLERGRQLAGQVCATCHLFPEPELADRFTWSHAILPRMNDWLGYRMVDWTNHSGGAEVVASGRVPQAPVIDLASLRLIHDYYLSVSPLHAPPQPDKPAATVGLKHFRVAKSSDRGAAPLTSLVHIDEASRRLWIGKVEQGKLLMLGSNAAMLASVDMPNPCVHLLSQPGGFYATLVGSIFPSDLAQGQIVRLEAPSPGTSDGFRFGQPLLTGLRRPVECAAADLNGDGREDLVVATYGNVLGSFSWYAQRPDGSYEEHTLIDRAGAVGVKVHDFDGDGRPDIVVAMAQGQEGLFLFFNRGNGQFEPRDIVRKHPAWGFTHLEVVDFDKDGQMDLLVTNGDNGDNIALPNCLKPYHGVRLYLNKDQGNFQESWFYPMYGAYRALARDFDLDGDLDIAAIAYFPDYLEGANESFVYLENRGQLSFAASTMVESISGRWITMDAGDMDGDGDADIVLGAFNRSFGDVSKGIGDMWAQKGPSFLVLENGVRRPAP